MHVAEVDLNYAQYFPLCKRYISLYPQKNVEGSKTSGQDDTTYDITKKPSIWAEVEKRMVDGTLQELRNGSSVNVVAQRKIRSLQPSHAKSKSASTQAKLNDQVNDTTAKHPRVSERQKKKPSQPQEHQVTVSGGQKRDNKATDDNSDGAQSEGGFFEE